MTPRQRRNHIEALGKAASAPRKSWLGKSMLLTGIQSAWIKSLLTTWGEGVSGEQPHDCLALMHAGMFLRAGDGRIRHCLALQLHWNKLEQRIRGPQALNRSHAILWPQPATSIIDEAIHDDDVDFVEQSVLQALDVNDPVYIVGLPVYATTQKNLRHYAGTTIYRTLANGLGGQKTSSLVPRDIQGEGLFLYGKLLAEQN